MRQSGRRGLVSQLDRGKQLHKQLMPGLNRLSQWDINWQSFREAVSRYV
jgi:hypothetical protein